MRDSELINKVYNELKSEGKKIYKKEIKQYIDCYEKQDYTPMFSTDLYINRGGAYCRMLELIYRIRGEI